MDLVARFALGAYVFAIALGQHAIALLVGSHKAKRWPQPGAATLYRYLSAIACTLYMFGLHLSLGWVPDFVRYAGFPILVAGLGLTFWAQVTLGKNWYPGIAIGDDHELVTNGPYARIRHPLYSGFCLSAVGLSLISADLLATTSITLLAASLLARIWLEEQLLKRRYEQKYEVYQSQTGFLLPRLRRQ